MSKISKISTYDLRFPTSATLSGSDAMNPDPDYSSAYLEVETDANDGHKGIGFVFTIGRGNDVVIKVIESLAQRFVGLKVEHLLDDMTMALDILVDVSPVRWIGPEKDFNHSACRALLT